MLKGFCILFEVREGFKDTTIYYIHHGACVHISPVDRWLGVHLAAPSGIFHDNRERGKYIFWWGVGLDNCSYSSLYRCYFSGLIGGLGSLSYGGQSVNHCYKLLLLFWR
jgi:hypothetical protein